MKEYAITGLLNESLFLSAGAAILLVPALCIAGFVYLWYGLNHSTLIMTDTELVFDSVFYKQALRWDEVKADEIKPMHADERVLHRRTNGISFVGLDWGWYTAKDGRKLLVYATNKANRVFIPTTLDFDVIVSVDDADGFFNDVLTQFKTAVR